MIRASWRSPFGLPAAVQNGSCRFERTLFFMTSGSNLLHLRHAQLNILFILIRYWRRERDSNPRYAIHAHTLSRRALSTAQAPLHNFILFVTSATSIFHDSSPWPSFHACPLVGTKLLARLTASLEHHK